eukprot:CAMPEP_0183713546 /NCGR_PEP_ID=MMETSP0737-20130205/8362_1 /TAXON_ID=385413 /ORGANISM="Thalassiosira miniscula, Strain CCMP1093" /LENGTH=96 /DNA_ID=CAMNT_0025942337 /DNA_START=23 /DNA_END=313 /DNA_ORIENTATION=+
MTLSTSIMAMTIALATELAVLAALLPPSQSPYSSSTISTSSSPSAKFVSDEISPTSNITTRNCAVSTARATNGKRASPTSPCRYESHNYLPTAIIG